MSGFKNLEHPVDRINRIQKEIDNPTRNWGTGYIAEVMLDYAREYYLAQQQANEASTSENKALDIDLVIETLKAKLEINAGKLAEPLLRQGKQPKEDKECHEAFIMCAHLAEIEQYLSSR